MDKQRQAQAVSAMQPNIDVQMTTDVSIGGLTLHEKKCLGYINLRMHGDYVSAKSAVELLLGCELPTLERTARGKDYVVLGISPSEWLIITPAYAETTLVDALSDQLNGHHHLVADVSGGTTMLNITGENAQNLLEKGTYVDLHGDVFTEGQFYNTQIAHAPAVILKNNENDFSLIVRRSFANHIAEWALDGAREFGVCFS